MHDKHNDECHKCPREKESLNKFAFPQLHWRLAALDERQFHDVKCKDEF